VLVRETDRGIELLDIRGAKSIAKPVAKPVAPATTKEDDDGIPF